jgi:hypothetical protein
MDDESQRLLLPTDPARPGDDALVRDLAAGHAEELSAALSHGRRDDSGIGEESAAPREESAQRESSAAAGDGSAPHEADKVRALNRSQTGPSVSEGEASKTNREISQVPRPSSSMRTSAPIIPVSRGGRTAILKQIGVVTLGAAISIILGWVFFG